MTPEGSLINNDLYATLPDELLGRLLFTGDEKAFEAIYRRYWRSLYTMALWKTSSHIVAEEMVQELFLKLWENHRKTLIDNLEAYLKTALRYSVIGFIRRKLSEERVELDEAGHQVADLRADTGIDLEELSSALGNALNLLPEKTRLVFQMSRFEQRSTAEIAQQLGLSDRAVEYHITQSLRLLRFELKDYLSYAVVCSILAT
jgi:RNA polymerase sigma-70 factor (family 1)